MHKEIKKIGVARAFPQGIRWQGDPDRRGGMHHRAKTGFFHGSIRVIGVADGARGREISSARVHHGLKRLRQQHADTVAVRIQAGNRGSMQFYSQCGFTMDTADVTLGKILDRDGSR